MTPEALHRSMLEKYNADLVCGPETDLVIEGYPRSANSFTIRMLRRLQGKGPYLKIAHHIHAIENLGLGAHFGKPLVVLVRPPEDAILSYMIYSDRSVDFATKRYARFFSGVLALPVRPVTVGFDTVIRDFNQVVTRINAALAGHGLGPVPLSQDLEADTQAVWEVARERAAKIHGAKSDQHVGVPSAAREAIKAERRAEVQAHLAARPEVAELYDRVLEYGV